MTRRRAFPSHYRQNAIIPVIQKAIAESSIQFAQAKSLWDLLIATFPTVATRCHISAGGFQFTPCRRNVFTYAKPRAVNLHVWINEEMGCDVLGPIMPEQMIQNAPSHQLAQAASGASRPTSVTVPNQQSMCTVFDWQHHGGVIP